MSDHVVDATNMIARIAELEARILELEDMAAAGCDANGGGEHSIITQGKYHFCGNCGETVTQPTMQERARKAEARAKDLEARIIALETVTDKDVERACIAYAEASGGDWAGVRDRHKPIWRKSIRAALSTRRGDQ